MERKAIRKKMKNPKKISNYIFSSFLNPKAKPLKKFWLNKQDPKKLFFEPENGNGISEHFRHWVAVELLQNKI